MIKKILTGYDGSESANKAFSFALGLAVKHQAEPYVMAVSYAPCSVLVVR